MAEQAAQVVKMALMGGSFLALITRPFPFELGGGHGCVANSENFSRPGMAGVCAGKYAASIPGRIPGRDGRSPNHNRNRL
jgi:hypothetical protein